MRSLLRAVFIVALLSSVGCKKGDPGGTEAADKSSPASGGAPAVAARAAATLLEKAAPQLPASTTAVAILDVRAALGAMLSAKMPLLPPNVDVATLRADLGRVMDRFMGFDLFRADFGVAFADLRPKSETAGVVLVGDFGKVQLPGKPETVGGAAVVRLKGGLYGVARTGWLAVGSKKGIEQLVSAGPKLAGAALTTLSAALERAGAGFLGVAADVRGVSERLLKGTPVAGIAVTAVSAAVGTPGVGLVVSVAADDPGRAKLKGFAESGLSLARGYLQTLAGRMDVTDELEAALAGLAAKHFGLGALRLVDVSDADGAVTAKVSLGASGGTEAMANAVLAEATVVGLLYGVGARGSAQTLLSGESHCDRAFVSATRILTASMEKSLEKITDEATRKQVRAAYAKEFTRDMFMRHCRKEPRAVQACLAEATTEAALNECAKRR